MRKQDLGANHGWAGSVTILSVKRKRGRNDLKISWSSPFGRGELRQENTFQKAVFGLQSVRKPKHKETLIQSVDGSQANGLRRRMRIGILRRAADRIIKRLEALHQSARFVIPFDAAPAPEQASVVRDREDQFCSEPRVKVKAKRRRKPRHGVKRHVEDPVRTLVEEDPKPDVADNNPVDSGSTGVVENPVVEEGPQGWNEWVQWALSDEPRGPPETNPEPIKYSKAWLDWGDRRIQRELNEKHERRRRRLSTVSGQRRIRDKLVEWTQAGRPQQGAMWESLRRLEMNSAIDYDWRFQEFTRVSEVTAFLQKRGGYSSLS